jgi:signal transduction histidine kinase
VRQVVLNLLSNAVKFTEQGEVLVEAVKDGEAMVCISVRDTGVGIGEDDLNRIFEPFTQVDQSMTRRAAGTGLGLSVSRQLAELMGGTLTVASTPGQGSTFRFTLPLDGVARAHVPPKIERRVNPPGLPG